MLGDQSLGALKPLDPFRSPKAFQVENQACYCCHPKRTDERRQATRGVRRLLGRREIPDPSINGPDPSMWPGFAVRLAYHLTYTQSGGCRFAACWFPTYINTCKRQSESCSARRITSAIRSGSSPLAHIESMCQRCMEMMSLDTPLCSHQVDPNRYD